MRESSENLQKKLSHRLFLSSFTLVEVLIYMGILVIITIFVVSGLIQLATAYAKARNLRHVNEIGAHTMERIVKEIRKATVINTASGATLSMQIPRTYAELVKYGSDGTNGAVAHWDFEETSGNTLVDKIGSNHGTVFFKNGGMPPEKGVLAIAGNGYGMNSLDEQYIRFADNGFNSLTTGAIEAIIKREVGNITKQTIFAGMQVDSGLDKMVHVLTEDDGIGLWKAKIFKTISPIIADSNASNDKFYHIVFQVDGTGTRIFVNGEQVKSDVNTAFFSTINENTQYFAGAKRIGSGSIIYDPLDGVFDELAIYNASHDLAFWKSHYDTAFGNTFVTKTETIMQSGSGSITLQENGGTAESLSAGKVTISNLAFTEILGTVGGVPNTKMGVRIILTATAGTGDSQVTKTFMTSAMMRNLE
ncbi:MAG: LamG-like jellyroll fold domain-containing protein [Patescibacteria group bacterium]